MNPDLPVAHGLYDPRFEHDACGVSFVANIKGIKSREIVTLGLTALTNMEHRGATGAEAETGDGAGILIQVPDAFFRASVSFDLPAAGAYAAGMAFLPQAVADVDTAIATVEKITAEEGLRPLGWRDVPVNPSCLGASALAVMPTMKQYFVDDPKGAAGIDLDRKLFIVRKRIEHELTGIMRTYFSSLSARTFVYKGMLTTPELQEFFLDLSDDRMESALALVHSRFSTNTFPSWPLAHPYRFIAHNGEINTVQGNRNWMRTREALLQSDLIPGLDRAFPICAEGMSDSASFDEVLELLHLAGRSLPHALLMMIPEAWENNDRMDPKKRAFYQFHASMMEPWDGPADVCFTDGTLIGAVLDRNGLRPGRYWVTSDGFVVLASEAGVLDIDQKRIVRKGRMQPGRMFLIDTEQGRLIDDDEIKMQLASEHPYAEWLEKGLTQLDDLAPREHIVHSHDSVARRQQMFGYTEEELKVILAPTSRTGAEPLGSMGTDTPIAVLSDRSRLLFDYFQQLFAQVTNP
ncbi:MAG: glutamate synthase large subunit, partial [Actinomycetota bacterium]